MIEELDRQDVEDILYGATIFGAGGGGELSEGFGLIDTALAAGKRLRMMSLADVEPDAIVCTPYLLGALSDTPAATETPLYGNSHPCLMAFRRLRAYLDQPIFGAVPCELGGSNTAVPFFVAAMEDAVVIDADPAGRAVPEITHSSYFLGGLPASPIVTANAMGETMVLESIADDQRAETVVRALAEVSGNDIAAIDHALPASALRGALVPGTLSRARHLGKLWREGRTNPSRLPQDIARATGGRVLFQGRVSESTWSTEGGFTVGTFSIDGQSEHHGEVFRVDLKNENMIGWRNGEPVVTIPEIITVVDTETGDIVTNPHARIGQMVSVLVLPAPDIFLSPKGLATFGPSYAGLDRPFKSALT